MAGPSHWPNIYQVGDRAARLVWVPAALRMPAARSRPAQLSYARKPPVPERSGSSVDHLEFKANSIGAVGTAAIAEAIAQGSSAMRSIDLSGVNSCLPTHNEPKTAMTRRPAPGDPPATRSQSARHPTPRRQPCGRGWRHRTGQRAAAEPRSADGPLLVGNHRWRGAGQRTAHRRPRRHGHRGGAQEQHAATDSGPAGPAHLHAGGSGARGHVEDKHPLGTAHFIGEPHRVPRGAHAQRTRHGSRRKGDLRARGRSPPSAMLRRALLDETPYATEHCCQGRLRLHPPRLPPP